MNLSSKRLIFVTGKGGVGKSVCAAAVAWREARAGRRVCLFELGNQSFYESFFETRGISYEPSEVFRDVHISLLTPESSIREYCLHFIMVPKLYDLFFQNKIIKAFLNASPAVSELSILGKLTGEIRSILKREYDVFVVDCYSTGHALALLRASGGLMNTFKSGPLHDQAQDIDRILKDPSLTHYVLVTLPEEMPVSEGSELYATLKAEFGADISIVCNKLMVSPLTRSEELSLKENIQDPNMKEFLEYLEFKQKIQREQIARISFMAPQFYGVPLILKASRGLDYVEIFAKNLESPWVLTNS